MYGVYGVVRALASLSDKQRLKYTWKVRRGAEMFCGRWKREGEFLF